MSARQLGREFAVLAAIFGYALLVGVLAVLGVGGDD